MTIAFEHRCEIAASPDLVFDLSLSVDAHVASMARSGERAVGPITTGILGEGDEVTWRARHFRIPFRLTSRVTEVDRPRRFVDDQVRGPFARFHHEHRLEPTATGTRMIDRIEFEAPLGPIGRAVERVLLARYLRELIEERAAYLKSTAEAI